MMRTRLARLLRCAAVALCSVMPSHAQTELRLWPGEAPGSEQLVDTGVDHDDRPPAIALSRTSAIRRLTVFLPDAAIATGAAVVIAPGGALRVLAFDNEGVKLAEWLNERGIAGFVLKYRTLQQDPSAPRGPPPGMPGAGSARRRSSSSSTPTRIPHRTTPRSREVLELAVADAQAALKLVRSRADQWGIDRERVGIIGFSAGGGVAVGTALAAKSDASPDFLVSVYGPSLQDVNVPAHAPPLFIAVGATHFNVTNGCLALFAAWKAAAKPAEIHVYDGISAGFGMTKRGNPVDGWTDRLHEWLVARELTRRVDPAR